MQRKSLQNLCIGASIFFAPVLVSATGVITAVSGYIYTSEQISNDPSQMTIYAGKAGTSCSGGSSSTPCTGSCSALGTLTSGATTFFCNDVGVHNDLVLNISFRGTDAGSYGTTGSTLKQSFLKAYIGQTEVTHEPINLPTAGVANQVVTIPLKWGTIATAAGKTLSASFKATMKVGFNPDDASDPSSLKEAVTIEVVFRYVGISPLQKMGCDSSVSNYSGFCQYGVYPGDEKLYIVNGGAFTESNSTLAVQDLQTTALDASDPSGMTAKAVRFFFRENGDFNSFTPNQWDTTDVAISNGSLAKGRITGLANGHSYSVMAANVDKGGNVTYFFDCRAAAPNAMSDQDPYLDSNVVPGSTQAATPQTVTGLLDNKNCFIATAAYGSGDAADVEALRKFRNSYLLNWEGGRSFVKFYYKHSPPIAKFIAEREWLKFIVRESLKPFVFVAHVAFNYGVAGLIALFFGALTIFSASIAWLRKGRAA